MARRESRLDPDAGPLQAFAHGLRELRYRAGEPSYRDLARKAFVSAGALSEAAGGKKLPGLATTLAYVRACGGDEREWEQRWLRVKSRLAGVRRSDPLAEGDPAKVGPFRLEGRLGAGAAGRVYLGRTPAGRPVAVKVIHPELADDPLFRRRFAREVEAARRVHGLYVAALVDADPDATRPWLATAYIPGPTLRAAVAEHGPLPVDSLLPLAAGMAEALEAIFAAGLVHRDLKPANVLLAEGGPRIIDFGIARALDRTQLTRTGTGVGTPGFIAPEQVRGLPAGPEADVFALGGVLAYAATGRPPFGDGPAESVLYRLVHEPPALEGLPSRLREVVEACLDKDPARRPPPAQVIGHCRGDDAPSGWLPPALAAEVTERAEAAASAEPRAGRRRAVVTAVAAAVALVAAFLVGTSVGTGGDGALRLHRDTVPAHVDLTALGVLDWVHWGHLDSDEGRTEEYVGDYVDRECHYNLHCVNRKRGANHIGDYTPIGNTAPFRLRHRDAATDFSWRDGEPTPIASDVKSLEYAGMRGNGFRLTAPADRAERELTVYLAVYQGKAKCAGSLSDGSADAVEDDTLNTFGTFNTGRFATCSFRYRAGRDGQRLAVELVLVEDIGGGNVALLAATLR
ncbi:hypothetical protein JOF41_002296 [Saccharothrix coeruleofusca]|uniref:serine/threonine-protein kinase n=1 Tax=Saccharothrix coeruleofusca TaxID=33919 RepID=UPI001AE47111|nr:serine/threonine-protein kinase [Saccharothrix coeruleofusca]MBP2336118.1 hypothetical protein [Saccharothrix coeruleofusca]